MLKKIFLYIFLFPFIICFYFLKSLFTFITKILNFIYKFLKDKIKFEKDEEQDNQMQNYNYKILKYSNLDDIDKLDGLQFESFVANLLKKLNYNNVKLTPATGDFGIDILCEKDNIKYAIQCKNYNNVLGSKPIQEAFSGKEYYKCHIGVVITNNYFTNHAQELAKNNGILLWDRAILEKMIRQSDGEVIIKESIIENDIDDPLFNKVLEFAINTQKISASLIQRKFKIGYNRASRLIDMLEDKGYISVANGSKPRIVLVKKE